MQCRKWEMNIKYTVCAFDIESWALCDSMTAQFMKHLNALGIIWHAPKAWRREAK